MRKTEPANASPARSYSLISVSRTTTPSPVPGSYDLITPCMFVARARQWVTFWTLPALMQPVQALSRRVAPPKEARTRWMFGFQRRLVFRLEWLTELPKPGFLPQISQTAAIGALTRDAVKHGCVEVTRGSESSQSRTPSARVRL